MCSRVYLSVPVFVRENNIIFFERESSEGYGKLSAPTS